MSLTWMKIGLTWLIIWLTWLIIGIGEIEFNVFVVERNLRRVVLVVESLRRRWRWRRRILQLLVLLLRVFVFLEKNWINVVVKNIDFLPRLLHLWLKTLIELLQQNSLRFCATYVSICNCFCHGMFHHIII